MAERVSPGEAARRAKAARDKAAHDKKAGELNSTTYADKPAEGYVDPRTATEGLASRIKKKATPTPAPDKVSSLQDDEMARTMAIRALRSRYHGGTLGTMMGRG